MMYSQIKFKELFQWPKQILYSILDISKLIKKDLMFIWIINPQMRWMFLFRLLTRLIWDGKPMFVSIKNIIQTTDLIAITII